MCYKGRVNGRYRGWCNQLVSKVFSKCCQKYVFNLLFRVEVGNEMSMIDSSFHKQGTLIKRNDMSLNL